MPKKQEYNSSDKTHIALIEQKLDFVVQELSDLRVTNTTEHKEIQTTISSNYITKDQFQRLVDRVDLHQKILYGAVSLILVAFVAEIINLVIGSK
jgi:hypothetical protein